MKIDWKEYENREHVLAWFLVEAMTAAGIHEFTKDGDLDSSNLEVKLRINGIEVPIVRPMDFLQEQLDRIKEEGREEGYNAARDRFIERIGRCFDDE